MNNTLVLFDPKNALEEVEKEVDKQFVVEGSPKTHLWKCFISEDKKIHSGFCILPDEAVLVSILHGLRH